MSTRTTERLAGKVAEVNRLSFPEIKEKLEGQPAVALEGLHRALESDYRIITYLLQHASGLGAQSLEQKVLLLDYGVMQIWYRLTKAVSESQARAALREMSNILAYFASDMGERSASLS